MGSVGKSVKGQGATPPVSPRRKRARTQDNEPLTRSSMSGAYTVQPPRSGSSGAEFTFVITRSASWERCGKKGFHAFQAFDLGVLTSLPMKPWETFAKPSAKPLSAYSTRARKLGNLLFPHQAYIENSLRDIHTSL